VVLVVDIIVDVVVIDDCWFSGVGGIVIDEDDTVMTLYC